MFLFCFAFVSNLCLSATPPVGGLKDLPYKEAGQPGSHKGTPSSTVFYH